MTDTMKLTPKKQPSDTVEISGQGYFTHVVTGKSSNKIIGAFINKIDATNFIELILGNRHNFEVREVNRD